MSEQTPTTIARHARGVELVVVAGITSLSHLLHGEVTTVSLGL